ncbi:MAG TPA: SDR family oxidoreductase [Alphaproteobacteria bacterium]|nr:SDR family oxidoreductase [Alphaproteobacteria bacterium]
MTRTALITGCSSGLGAAAARLFAARGWNVVATMRRPEDAAALGFPANVLVARLDVQDRASIAEAVAFGIARFGGIDAVVNNAGFGLFGVFEGTPREKVLEQFDVNVFGLMDVVRAVLPHFRAKRAGTIVNVGSGAGVFTLPMLSLYCASKFALEGFSEALAYEVADLGIAVRIVEPGGVPETGFGRRNGVEAGAVEPLADYAAFVEASGAVYAELYALSAHTTAEAVAEVIHEAATDPTDRLRYVVGDAIRPMVEARRETSEAEYLALMRRRFAPKLPAADCRCEAGGAA